jgi:hypothetical protein
MVVTMKNAFFWVVTPCGSCKNRPFGGACRLHQQGWRCLTLFQFTDSFRPDFEGNTFLRNVSSHKNHAALLPRRRNVYRVCSLKGIPSKVYVMRKTSRKTKTKMAWCLRVERGDSINVFRRWWVSPFCCSGLVLGWFVWWLILKGNELYLVVIIGVTVTASL